MNGSKDDLREGEISQLMTYQNSGIQSSHAKIDETYGEMGDMMEPIDETDGIKPNQERNAALDKVGIWGF